MNLLPINVAVNANRVLARSALPDAPVVEDKPRRHAVRTAIRAVLRTTADEAAGDGRLRPAARHTAHKPAESC